MTESSTARPSTRAKSRTPYSVAMNVVVRPDTKAERKCRYRAGLIRPQADETAAAREAAATATPHGKIVPGIPRTPSRNLVFRNGQTIPNLVYCNFYVGGSNAWQADDRKNIDDKLAKAMSDSRLNGVMSQYFNDPIKTTFHGPSTILDGPPPAKFSRANIESLVKSLNTTNAFQGLNLSRTVMTFLLPTGTELTDDDSPDEAREHEPGARQWHANQPVADRDDQASSLEGLGGYHGSVKVHSERIYYAIGVFSEMLPDGRQNGIVAFDRPWKNVVATMYHELNEARTDPDVEEANNTGDESLVGWTSSQGEEIGDFPIFEDVSLTHVFKEVPLVDNSERVPIQFMYSNRVDGPEDPTI